MRYLEHQKITAVGQLLDHAMQLFALAGAGRSDIPDGVIDPELLMTDDEDVITTGQVTGLPDDRWLPPSDNAPQEGSALYTAGLLLHRMMTGSDIINSSGWTPEIIWAISNDEESLLSDEDFEEAAPELAGLKDGIRELTSFTYEGRMAGFRRLTALAYEIPCRYSIEYTAPNGETVAAEEYAPEPGTLFSMLRVGASLPEGTPLPEEALIYRPGAHRLRIPVQHAQQTPAVGGTPQPVSEPEEIIVGIDLGTETTMIAKASEDGSTELLTFDGDEVYIPSILLFNSREDLEIGDTARNKAKRHPRACVSRFKRQIGSSAPISGDIVALDGSVLQCTGQQAAGLFLSELRKETVEHGHRAARVVLSIPADFSSVQRRQAREAVLQAGYLTDELRMIEEPTAAAIYYGCNKRNGLTAVADLGGGTFDCCVMECDNGRTSVRTKGSDLNLGGCDFSDELAALIKRRADQAGVRLFGDDEARNARMEFQISTFAERMKLELSTETEASASIPYRNGSSMAAFDVTVTRGEFEELLAPYITRITAVIRDVLSAGGYSAEDIGSVVLMGGSTYIPIIEKSIREQFSRSAVYYESERTAAVALGAAQFAAEVWESGLEGSVSAETTAAAVISSTQDDLGVADSRREFHCIIPNGSIYSENGFSAEHSFNFTEDSVKELDIYLYRRRRGCALDRLPVFADGRIASIGSLHFHDLPGERMRSCTLRVSFSLDKDGTLNAVGEVSDISGRVIHRESAAISA